MLWDEENRLRGINDNGRLHLYTYDHTGERALKSSAESSMAVINGATSAIITHTEDYTAYVSPYFVVQKGKFTKHYFEGSSRVVSKLGEGTFVHKNTGIMAGGLDYLKRTQKEQEARDKYIKGLQVPPGPPTQHGIYASPEWTGEAYPSIDWSEVSQNQEPPEGWPRPPKFNEPGDVPGPPVQFGEAITNANVKAGYGYIPNGVEERNLYYYHPDHLGSSSYITDREGQIIQHTEYIAFGETFVDEHSTSNKQPYLFNGKELDYETGLYYYGARYYDPKTSLWLNTDPLSGYNPIQETEHYIDGQHNGGVHNPMNLNTYTYTYQNPVVFVDPNGKQNYSFVLNGKKHSYTTKSVNVYAHTIVWSKDGYVRFRNSQADKVVNRIQSSYKPLNNWTGSSEAEITIFPKGADRPFKISSMDVPEKQRATFVSDISKMLGAFSGDKVRALEENNLSSFLSEIGVGADVLSTLKGTPALNILAYTITANDFMTELMVAQEKGKYNGVVSNVSSTVINEVLGAIVEKKGGKFARGTYELMIAPKVENAVKQKINE